MNEKECVEVLDVLCDSDLVSGNNKFLQALQFAISRLQEQPRGEPKEPIYYDCTLTKFAEQLNVPLWKAMEFGKFFKIKNEKFSDYHKVDEFYEK